MKRARLARPELSIQLAFRQLMRFCAPAVELVAIPNAAKRGWNAQRQMRAEGLVGGFFDVMALAGRPQIAAPLVAFIEFKSADGVLSENQKDCHRRQIRRGFPCGTFVTPDDACEFLRSYGFPFLMAPFEYQDARRELGGFAP